MPFVDDTPQPTAAPTGSDETMPTDFNGRLGPVAFVPKDPAEGYAPAFSVARFAHETLPAGLREGNTVGAFLARAPGLPDGGSIDPTFDPFDHIDGYEPYASRFAFANSGDEVAAEKRQIDGELATRDTLASSGWSGTAAAIVAGAVDPINYIPVGGELAIGYRVGGSILKGALSTARAGLLATTAQEALLHNEQETRTWGESAANVAAGTFLSGILGAAGAGVHELLTARGGRTFADLARGTDSDLTVPAPHEPDPITPGFRRVSEAELTADVGPPSEAPASAGLTRDRLASSTSLTPARSSEVPADVLERPVAAASEPPAPVVSVAHASRDGGFQTFDTIDAAERAAATQSRRSGEDVTAADLGDGTFGLRRTSTMEPVRDPDGTPTAFDNVRAAERAKTQLYKNDPELAVVPFKDGAGKRSFALVRNASAADLRAAAEHPDRVTFGVGADRSVAALDRQLAAKAAEDTARKRAVLDAFNFSERKAARALLPELTTFAGEDLQALNVDHARFGIKDTSADLGETWDQSKSGVAVIYEDLDGKRTIVDGRERLVLAKRALVDGEQPSLDAVVLKASAGETPESAALAGAFKNIAEGSLDPAAINMGNLDGKNLKTILAALAKQPGRTGELAAEGARALEAGKAPGVVVGGLVRDLSRDVSQGVDAGGAAGGARRAAAGEARGGNAAGDIATSGRRVAPAALKIDAGALAKLKTSIRALVDRARTLKGKEGNEKANLELGPVTPEGAVRINEALKAAGVDVDVTGFRHTIDNYAIRHSLGAHGDAKAEAARGQIELTPADVERVPDVLAAPDSIQPGRTRQAKGAVVYSKTFEDGTTIYIEEARAGKRELAAVTMWKERGAPERSDNTLKEGAPQSHVQDALSGNPAAGTVAPVRVTAQGEGGSLSSAAVRDTTLAEEGLKSALGAEKALKFSDPLLRAATSPSIATRRIMQDLAESPLTYEKNRHGIATAAGGSVETRMKLWRAPLAKALQFTDDAFVRYRLGRSKRMGDLAAIGAQDLGGVGRRRGLLTYAQFRDEIGKAMRRGDQHPIPEISDAAQQWRRLVFDPLKDEAIKLGMLPKDVTTETATSYLMRLYNTEKIVAQRPQFVDTTTTWLAKRRADAAADIPRLERELAETEAREKASKGEKSLDKNAGAQPGADDLREQLEEARERAGRDDLELRDVADQITDRILGTPDGRLPYDSQIEPRPRVGGRGGVGKPLRGRTFLIPDEMIEPWLESNVELLGRIYTRSMASDVEMTRRFGDVDLVKQLGDIRNDYANKAYAAASDGDREKLQTRRDADIRDVAAVRDRLRGTYALPRDPNSVAIRAARVAKSLNYLRLLGGMTLSSLPDTFRVVMAHGLQRTMGDGLVPLVSNLKKFRLASEEVKLAGTALDMVLDSRAMAIADIMDDFGRHSSFERAIHSATTNYGVVSLQAPWNAFWKQFSGVVTMTRILEAAEASRAGTIADKEIEKLAAGGIDESLARRIAEQFAAHGETTGGLRLANTEKWSDGQAVLAFRSALARDVDRIIVTPGQDKPLWTSTVFGSVVSQFKAFSFASMQRIAIAGLQDRDAGTLAGLVGMTIAGMAVYALKSLDGGYKTSTNPADWLLEGIDRSGVSGWLFDANNIIEKATRGTVGLKAMLGSKQPMSRYASRNVTDALLGPTLGLVEDGARVIGDASQVIKGDITGDGRAQWMKSDTRALRRLLPYQNLLGVRHLFDATEDGVNRSLGVYR